MSLNALHRQILCMTMVHSSNARHCDQPMSNQPYQYYRPEWVFKPLALPQFPSLEIRCFFLLIIFADKCFFLDLWGILNDSWRWVVFPVSNWKMSKDDQRRWNQPRCFYFWSFSVYSFILPVVFLKITIGGWKKRGADKLYWGSILAAYRHTKLI